MKLVGLVYGLAAVKVSGDAVAPLDAPVTKDFVEAVGRKYEFVTKPPLQPALQGGHSMVFQGGALKTGDRRTGILQLMLFPNGDMVMAQTTEQADTVLSDLLNFLEETFGFRYKSTEQKRLYLSNVVVQFDKEIGQAFDRFAAIENLLNDGKEPPRFQFKRLSFGQGDLVTGPLSVETLEIADFAIERRGGEPYSLNRFFCSAPMQTREHLALLEKLEGLLSAA
jgi:hypothetical protein